jgi:hypothetical protein
MPWEYLTCSWQFVGPDVDDWPGREAYAEGLRKRDEAPSVIAGAEPIGPPDLLDTDEGQRLELEYRNWRYRVELEYLNEIGAAGFELVSVSRDTERLTEAYHPIIRAHAYFKRPAEDNAPEPPRRRIGFLSPEEADRARRKPRGRRQPAPPG